MQNEIAQKYIDLLGIKTPSVDQAIENLSGGNQQKVIVARWLATNPEVLIVDEPTRGIDVGAKTEIQKLIVKLSQEGMGVLFISSEIEEVVRCSNRVYVLQERGSSRCELTEGDIDEHKIMHTIAGKGGVMMGIGKGKSIPKIVWPLLALGAILLFNLIFTDHFFRITIREGHLFGSLIDILRRCSPTMIMAIAMTYVIATGGIDISVGSVLAISGSIASLVVWGGSTDLSSRR